MSAGAPTYPRCRCPSFIRCAESCRPADVFYHNVAIREVGDRYGESPLLAALPEALARISERHLVGGIIEFVGSVPPVPPPSPIDGCDCDHCQLMRGSQWTAEQAAGFGAARRDRVMRGVDMPGRIVDDVRPDQRS